jgi:hypothetical protein
MDDKALGIPSTPLLHWNMIDKFWTHSQLNKRS